MRWTGARGATAAGALPAAFLVALLVGAPFAGTTTAPLIADRAATAPAASSPGADQAPTTSYDAVATATVRDGQPSTTAGGDAATTTRPTLQVPQASMTTLVVSWLTLAFVGLAVLMAAARGTGRRRGQAPASGSAPRSW